MLLLVFYNVELVSSVPPVYLDLYTSRLLVPA